MNMNAIELKVDGSASIRSFHTTNGVFDYFKGIFDIVRCKENLEYPYVLLVDDCGYEKGFAVNAYGSYFYGSGEHGHLIVGDVLIMKEVLDPEEGEYTLDGLSDEEISALSIKYEFCLEPINPVQPVLDRADDGRA